MTKYLQPIYPTIGYCIILHCLNGLYTAIDLNYLMPSSMLVYPCICSKREHTARCSSLPNKNQIQTKHIICIYRSPTHISVGVDTSVEPNRIRL
jgi:hypothetical protein